MAMRVYVLHLLRAEKRRQNARDLLRNCGVAGSIWPAVDGAAMSSTDLNQSYGADLCEPAYPFALRTGEIGCFLSHRQIWADMQDRSEDAALIIEDDAGLDLPLFQQAMALATEHVHDLGYIQLQTRAPRGPSRLIDKNGPCALVLPEVAGLRTTAQVVSRTAAAQLLARSDPFDRPVDTYVQSFWHTGLKPAMITPSGVLEIADQLDGSTIQSADKTLWEKARREVARARYRAAVRRISRKTPTPVSYDE
ncbi:glycosyltransferase family 25 protein [Pseudohalocynthiibacter aestuariivivens]|nr:glycosyltransferase family 25 protein [Pseudohalocynthiibacter aestuariivivens]QIE45400.1 glycosyltransferase family 25 protein [Pseudohalocynthiibacter aestuariivivens]